MKIAYLILAHTDAPQLGRLVRALADPDNGIFVHVDKKVDEAPFRQACDGTEQVRFVKNRIKVYWGGGIPMACSDGDNKRSTRIEGALRPLRLVDRHGLSLVVEQANR